MKFSHHFFLDSFKEGKKSRTFAEAVGRNGSSQVYLPKKNGSNVSSLILQQKLFDQNLTSCHMTFAV